MSTIDPTITLAIDNCFAKKRWPMPDDWAPVIADLGVYHVELSADTEADPMYHGAAYLARWDAQVERACTRHGLTPASLYSGHGSYTTMGLLHPDDEVVERMVSRWLEPTIRRAAAFGADMGFFFHAVAESDLHDPARYRAAVDRLIANLERPARTAQDAGVLLGLEQMYSPQQPPWTISGAIDIITRVTDRSAPLYLTVDTGHASAQMSFAGATAADADPYAWLSAVGPWSPIIHLQQTDGTRSAHLPFTANHNRTGIIEPASVLRALAAGYAASHETGMPPQTDHIALTLEMFAGTAQESTTLLSEIGESVAYWRTVIPQDGLPLSELVARLG